MNEALFSVRDARGFRALAIFRRGALRDAEADAEDALRAAPRTYGFAFPAVTAVLAEVLMERGELGKAERRLAVARVPDRLGVLDLFCVAAEGRLLRKRGDFAGALARFERCGAGLVARVENPAVLSWRTGGPPSQRRGWAMRTMPAGSSTRSWSSPARLALLVRSAARSTPLHCCEPASGAWSS